MIRKKSYDCSCQNKALPHSRFPNLNFQKGIALEGSKELR